MTLIPAMPMIFSSFGRLLSNFKEFAGCLHPKIMKNKGGAKNGQKQGPNGGKRGRGVTLGHAGHNQGC